MATDHDLPTSVETERLRRSPARRRALAALALLTSSVGCTLREEGSGPLGAGPSGPTGTGGASSSTGGAGQDVGPPVWAAEEPSSVDTGYDLPGWLDFK